MKITNGLLMSSMLVLTSLSVSDAAWAGNNKDKNKAANPPGKIFICHLTSSSKNPSVLIHVSTSAAAAHYAHGDPEEIRYLENGDCAAPESEPEPEYQPEPQFVEMCASSTYDGSFTNNWYIDYFPATGAIEGTGVVENGREAPPLTGTVIEKGEMFAAGKTIELEAAGVTAHSTTPSFVGSAGDLPFAMFGIQVGPIEVGTATVITFTQGCEGEPEIPAS